MSGRHLALQRVALSLQIDEGGGLTNTRNVSSLGPGPCNAWLFNVSLSDFELQRSLTEVEKRYFFPSGLETEDLGSQSCLIARKTRPAELTGGRAEWSTR